MTTLSEDFLLLMLDDATGKPLMESTRLSYGLAGGALLDLALAGRITVPPRGAPMAGRVVVISSRPLGHPILDQILTALATDKPRKPENVISRLSTNIRQASLSSIEAQGYVRRSDDHVLGFIPRTLWPAITTARKNAIRSVLQAVLVNGQPPDQQTAAIIGLLSATNALGAIVANGPDRRAITHRGKEIAEGNWASSGVEKAIQDIQTAVIMATLLSATSATAVVNM